jgi:hypothetical protein
MDGGLPAGTDLKQRWPRAALGLRLVALTVVAQAALSLVTSALTTYALDRSSGGGSYPGFLFEITTWAWRLLGPVLVLSFLLALELMARQGEALGARALVRLAQLMVALDLVAGIGLELLEFVLPRFVGGVEIYPVIRIANFANIGLSMIADALLLEVLLRMRREASGAEAPGVLAALPARAIFWTIVAVRVVLIAGSQLLHAKWPGYWWQLLAVRGGLVIGFAALIVALAFSALDAPIAAAAGPQPLGAPPAHAPGASPAVADDQSVAWRAIVSGAVILALGLAVTIGSLAAAQHGGGYVVAYGAIAVGVVQIIRGLGRL